MPFRKIMKNTYKSTGNKVMFQAYKSTANTFLGELFKQESSVASGGWMFCITS